jgi:hypothetical protein
MNSRVRSSFFATLAVLALASGVARAQETGGDNATNLAKKTQNPIAAMIILPFQNDTNFGFGPHQGTQDILNIQPVIPLQINEDWNVITRTIVPLIWRPSLQPAQTVPFGLGATQFSAFFSPRNPIDGWILGAGPIVQLPTAVAVRTQGAWVFGALVNNV